MSDIDILVIDDDPDVIRQLRELLSEKIGDDRAHYTFLEDFDEALAVLKQRRYDIVVSDIFVGRDHKHKTPDEAENRANEVVGLIRQSRACPIVLITDGTLPEQFKGKPFVVPIDKGRKLAAQIEEAFKTLLATGIPAITKSLHDQIDKFAGSFLWGFLENNWTRLQDEHLLDHEGLDRVFRRRAGFQLARVLEVEGSVEERETADPVDYYIMPPIGKHLRLGEILKSKGDGSFRIVLTPHCYLVVQQGAERPRADYVLTLKTVAAGDILKDKKWNDPPANIASRCAIPAREIGKPDGRYCFLPGFLDVPDLYCDFLQTEAIEYKDIMDNWERVAILDTPFAEALQSSYARLFGTVGLPTLNHERMMHLAGQPTAA